MTFISEDTHALLLLTAPLMVGTGDGADAPILSLSEYNKLAQRLKEMAAEPFELIGPARAQLIRELSPLQSPDRLETLLDRGFQMSQAIEKWNARGIWITSRADADYPEMLKTKLQERAPTLIYGCGEKKLLHNGGLAVVGSRGADEQSLEFTQSVSRLAASAGVTIISGGAKGVDRAAMAGSLEAGGTAVGVLADQLQRLAVAPDCREPIRDGRLTLISLVDPSVGFNVGNAMQRNKIIYCLADAALVVSSEVNKGGTWAGAIEQLDRFKNRAVYVRTNSSSADGNKELERRGALPWPLPANVEDFKQTLKTRGLDAEQFSPDSDLPLFAMQKH